MNILLTFDHELYFGQSGTIEKCIVEPGNQLLDISARHKVPLVFFVDAGMLFKLQSYSSDGNESAKSQLNKICLHLEKIQNSGHQINLHIHPHWEDAVLENGFWKLSTKRYKISDFSPEDAYNIILKYAAALSLCNINIGNAFRAGGWCIQPFSLFSKALHDLNINIDSSVIKGTKKHSEHYIYDFTTSPEKDLYKFSTNPAIEDSTGAFIEIPVSHHIVHPFFYWKLYALGRLNGARHKPIGNGLPIMEKGYRKNILTQNTTQYIGADGYNAKLLQRSLLTYEHKGHSAFVTLTHPKAMSQYSFETLEKFIKKNVKKHTFTTYNDILKNVNSIT